MKGDENDEENQSLSCSHSTRAASWHSIQPSQRQHRVGEPRGGSRRVGGPAIARLTHPHEKTHASRPAARRPSLFSLSLSIALSLTCTACSRPGAARAAPAPGAPSQTRPARAAPTAWRRGGRRPSLCVEGRSGYVRACAQGRARRDVRFFFFFKVGVRNNQSTRREIRLDFFCFFFVRAAPATRAC